MMASESCAMYTGYLLQFLHLTLLLKNIKEFSKHIIYFAKEVTNTKEVLLYTYIETCRQPFHLHASCIADGTVFFDASSGDITIDEQNNHVSITQGDWRGRMHDFAALEQDH